MERLGYYNGNYGPLEQMMVPMNDRVSWFGDDVKMTVLITFNISRDKNRYFFLSQIDSLFHIWYYNGCEFLLRNYYGIQQKQYPLLRCLQGIIMEASR